MMTAYGDIDLAIKAIKEGAVDFIVKPWDNTKMVTIVTSAFKKSPGNPPNIQLTTAPVEEEVNKEMSEDERVIMFHDITSSTTIPENIGHEKNFEL